MRARTVAGFILGFVLGALCLGVWLWWSGAIVTPYAPWRRAAAPTAGSINDLIADIGKQTPPPPQAEPVMDPLDFSEPAPAVAAAPVSPAEPDKLFTPIGHPPTPSPAVGHGDADRIVPDLTGLPHLQMPLSQIDPKKIGDTFNDTRTGHKHEALDMMAPRGTPVLAVTQGNVAKLFTSKDGGLTVYQFDNSRTFAFYYAHLERYAKGLQEGTLLRAGDVLGYVGSSGNAATNAPHLHFAVFKLGPEKKWWQGTAIDPLPLLK